MDNQSTIQVQEVPNGDITRAITDFNSVYGVYGDIHQFGFSDKSPDAVFCKELHYKMYGVEGEYHDWVRMISRLYRKIYHPGSIRTHCGLQVWRRGR